MNNEPVHLEASLSDIEIAEKLLNPKPDGEKKAEDSVTEQIESAVEDDFARSLRQPDKHELI